MKSAEEKKARTVAVECDERRSKIAQSKGERQIGPAEDIELEVGEAKET